MKGRSHVNRVYHQAVKRKTNSSSGSKNSRRKADLSKLGRALRRIGDEIFASGGKPRSRRKTEEEVAERRAAR